MATQVFTRTLCVRTCISPPTSNPGYATVKRQNVSLGKHKRTQEQVDQHLATQVSTRTSFFVSLLVCVQTVMITKQMVILYYESQLLYCYTIQLNQHVTVKGPSGIIAQFPEEVYKNLADINFRPVRKLSNCEQN